MAMSKRELDGAMKVEYLERVCAMLAAAGEEVATRLPSRS